MSSVILESCCSQILRVIIYSIALEEGAWDYIKQLQLVSIEKELILVTSLYTHRVVLGIRVYCYYPSSPTFLMWHIFHKVFVISERDLPPLEYISNEERHPEHLSLPYISYNSRETLTNALCESYRHQLISLFCNDLDMVCLIQSPHRDKM